MTPRYSKQDRALVLDDESAPFPNQIELHIRSAADARNLIDVGAIRRPEHIRLAITWGFTLEFTRAPGKRTIERLMQTLLPNGVDDPLNVATVHELVSIALVAKWSANASALASNRVQKHAESVLSEVVGPAADKRV